MRRAAAVGAGNAVLIKVNQAGTVSDAKAALDAAKALGLGSDRLGAFGRNRGCEHRPSGGRLGRGADQGRQLRRSERMAKWNELLRIEEAMGEDARVRGRERTSRVRGGAPPDEGRAATIAPVRASGRLLAAAAHLHQALAVVIDEDDEAGLEREMRTPRSCCTS